MLEASLLDNERCGVSPPFVGRQELVLRARLSLRESLARETGQEHRSFRLRKDT